MNTYHENQVPWPITKAKRTVRKYGPFQVNLATAAERVRDEVSKFTSKGYAWRTKELWIYASGKVGAKNQFLANQPTGLSPEVVVTFDLDGKEFSIAADAFREPEQNLAGIAEEIKSMRARARNGVQTLDEMLSAFSALPPALDWKALLGNPASIKEAEAVYRAKAKTAHPDVAGGSHEQMASLTAAIERAREELK